VKSQATDFLEVAVAVYKDATAKCIADVSDLRDLETIRSRVKDEGISFLTITLPNFCRDFERSLARGYIDSKDFSGFRKEKSRSIPAFLQGMVSQIFDRETGRIYDDEIPTSRVTRGDCNFSSTIIEGIRQICLTFKKVEIDCTPQRVQAALQSFVAIEQSFNESSVPESDYSAFVAVSDMLWGVPISKISLLECIPKHGPGATAEKLSGNQKYNLQRWHDRLEPYFPLVDNVYPLGIPESAKELEMVTIITQDQEQPVRVVHVPKTLKSPRVIAIEPCCMQYVQQGIRNVLYDVIESYWLSAGHVNFRDQSINQQLALTSSRDGQLVTIDLSDASDRVPRDLALEMFRSNPDLREAIDACRSTMAQLPDGQLVGPLKKFASMGSALCFPVEAMYFYTVCIVASLRAQNLPASPRNIQYVSKDLYVYGDDIIVSMANANAVLDHLQKYNCKVNTNKTFVSGSFRESCGVDAYRGTQVTPTYLRHMRPENWRQASQIISWVASANLFERRGYTETAQLLFKTVEQIIGPLPYVSETSEVLGRISYANPTTLSLLNREIVQCRWNKDYQRFEVKGWCARPVFRADRLEGYGALVKCFLRDVSLSDEDRLTMRDFLNGDRVPSGGSELERSALHGAVVLKRRWAPAH
jgi:hypothetical protein